MLTLQFYIIRQMIGPIILSGFFFTFLLLVMRIFSLADELLSAGISLPVLGQLMAVIFGTLMTMTVPMAMLLGVLIAVGRLTTENEILAIRAGGVSIFSVFLPALLGALLVSGGLVAVNQYAIPRMYQRVDQIRYEVQFDLLTNLQPQRFYTDLGTEEGDLTLHYERRGDASMLPEDHRQPGLVMKGVSMRFESQRQALLPATAAQAADLPPEQRADLDQEVRILVFARAGVIHGDPDTQRLAITLHDGAIVPLRGPTSERGTRIGFQRMEQVISEGRGDERAREPRDQELVFGDLLERLRNPPPGDPIRVNPDGSTQMRRIWRDYFTTRNEMIQRFSLPIAAFAFTLLAIPLAIEIRPRAKSFAFLLAVVLMGGYYAMYTFGGAVGANGASDAVAWTMLMLPNAVIIVVGAALFRRAMWR